jgi:hypothetical protein
MISSSVPRGSDHPPSTYASSVQAPRRSFRDRSLELRHRDGHLTSVLCSASSYRDESGPFLERSRPSRSMRATSGTFDRREAIWIPATGATRRRAGPSWLRAVWPAQALRLRERSAALADGGATDVQLPAHSVGGRSGPAYARRQGRSTGCRPHDPWKGNDS